LHFKTEFSQAKNQRRGLQMKPEKFSPFALYGNKEIFQKMLKNGYTEVAFGGGEWVDDFRIVGIFVFYHQRKKNVYTYQTPKFVTLDAHTMCGVKFEKKYRIKQFEKYVQKMKISIGPKTDLKKVLEKLN
jgi:hypothetical protein